MVGLEEGDLAHGDMVDLNAKASIFNSDDQIYCYITRDQSYAHPITEIKFNSSSSAQSGYIRAFFTSGSYADLNSNGGSSSHGGAIFVFYARCSDKISATYHYLDANGNRVTETDSKDAANHADSLTTSFTPASTLTYGGISYSFLGWRDDNTQGGSEYSTSSAQTVSWHASGTV